MSKETLYIIAFLLFVIMFTLGYISGRGMVNEDCTTLNQTIINGQHIPCRPYNPNPKEVM